MELTKEYFDEQLRSLATKDDVKATDERVVNLKKFLDENIVTREEFDNRWTNYLREQTSAGFKNQSTDL